MGCGRQSNARFKFSDTNCLMGKEELSPEFAFVCTFTFLSPAVLQENSAVSLYIQNSEKINESIFFFQMDSRYHTLNFLQVFSLF